MTEIDDGAPDMGPARQSLDRLRDTVKAVLQDFEDKDQGARAPRSERGNQIARERQATRARFKKLKDKKEKK